MKKLIPLIIIGLICMVGCKNIDTSKITPPYKVSFHQKGKEIKQINIPNNSHLEKQITEFLQNNKTGWKSSFVTYAPGLMVYGEKFSLLLDDNGSVLNYWPEKNKSFQGEKSSSLEMEKLKSALLEFLNKDS